MIGDQQVSTSASWVLPQAAGRLALRPGSHQCSLFHPSYGMSHLIRDLITHPNPRDPLVFDTRALGRRPGTARSETRLIPAPADLCVALACVPAGAEVKLEVRLEAVSEGVLATAEVSAPVTGECARCLEPVTSRIEVSFRELYEAEAGPASDGYDDADRRFLDAELLEDRKSVV